MPNTAWRLVAKTVSWPSGWRHRMRPSAASAGAVMSMGSSATNTRPSGATQTTEGCLIFGAARTSSSRQPAVVVGNEAAWLGTLAATAIHRRNVRSKAVIRAGSLFETLQVRQQVARFLARQRGQQTFRHQRELEPLDAPDLARSEARFAPASVAQDKAVVGLADTDAGQFVAVTQGHIERVVTLRQRRAGQDDGFDQITPGADGADLRQVRSHDAALSGDAMAGNATGLFGKPAPSAARI